MQPLDFASPEYRAVFTAMCELHLAGQPCSVETVASHLNRPDEQGKNLLASIGGQSTIAGTLNGASPDEVEFWSKETIRFRKKRELDEALLKYRDKVASATNPDKLRAELEEHLVGLAGSASAEVSHVSAASEALAGRLQLYIDKPDAITGLATGWEAWDRTLDGLRPGGVTIIYAKSSRYKSLFSQNMGHLFASQGIPGLWFTTEMPQLDVEERLLQLETGLNIRRLRKDGRIKEHIKELEEGLNTLDSLPIYMSEGFDLTVSSLRAEVKRQKRWNNIEYVIVDLVDHVSSNKFRDDIINQQSYIMRSIKDIAKKEHVHIICISHVAKGDKMNERLPELPYEDMKGSSSKYQDVDVSICIVPVTYGLPPGIRGAKEGWYGLLREEIMQSVATFGGVDVMVTITKNRDGDTGRFRFWMDANQGGRFLLTG